MKIIRTVFIVCAAMLLSSCFHKDVMNDRADDIAKAMVYQGKEGNFLICKEAVFQATSKSSGRGLTRISGYNEFRLSSYDISTGKLSARINLGKGMDDAECIILGETEGKIWCFSMDKSLGLHCRNPKTLEVIATQQQLSSNPQLKAIQFAQPKWYDLPKYYAFDWSQHKLVLSDMQGFKYVYNPANDSVVKTDYKIPPDFSDHYLESECNITEHKSLYTRGNDRGGIELNGTAVKGNLTFLNGKFIQDFDHERAGRVRLERETKYKRDMARLKDTIDKFNNAERTVSIDPRNGDAYVDDYKKRREMGYKADSLEKIEHYFKFNEGDDAQKAYLTDDPGSFFMYSASDVSDTAHAIIAKLKLNDDTTLTQEWSTPLNGLYYEPDKASKKGAFATVFSKGDPNFRFQWFNVVDGKLLLISQLELAAIDVKSGKLLWDIKI